MQLNCFWSLFAITFLSQATVICIIWYLEFMLLYPHFTILLDWFWNWSFFCMIYIPTEKIRSNGSDVWYTLGRLMVVPHWVDMKIHNIIVIVDSDDDSENGRRSVSYLPIRGPRLPSICHHLFFLYCLLHPRKSHHPLFRSMLTFSHPLMRRAVCLIRRGGRSVETQGCGVGYEEHTGVGWGIPRCPVWLRNNHWSPHLDS